MKEKKRRRKSTYGCVMPAANRCNNQGVSNLTNLVIEAEMVVPGASRHGYEVVHELLRQPLHHFHAEEHILLRNTNLLVERVNPISLVRCNLIASPMILKPRRCRQLKPTWCMQSDFGVHLPSAVMMTSIGSGLQPCHTVSNVTLMVSRSPESYRICRCQRKHNPRRCPLFIRTGSGFCRLYKLR
ncbi:hypothetical protein LX32DRAFT_93721 [Colletotrichum zoysiae]|uniref:Uncharacterized protein n=1 Tax=Colletotrichum zoysiae TaxID=1216348 RepID=A0AAD9LXC8_9PEZI|nr:hypothetical protein LX32DRAFT_93721 [Colletotrichum zoysiae]